MDKTGDDGSGLHLDKFEKRRPTFFQINGMSVHTCIKLSLTVDSWKIILSCYVAMILQMKDSWSANLTFRARN